MDLPQYVPYDLGVATTGKRVILYGNLLTASPHPLFVAESNNGTGFKASRKTARITSTTNESTLFAKDFRISQLGKKHVLFYKSNNHLKIAYSSDLLSWDNVQPLPHMTQTASVVPEENLNAKHTIYYGDNKISVTSSADLIHWENSREVLAPRPNFFDRHALQVGNVFSTSEGILVLYYVKEFFREGILVSIGAALFSPDHPDQLIWRSNTPLATHQLDAHSGELYPLGAVELHDELIFYFGVRGKEIFALKYGLLREIFNDLPKNIKPRLQKHQNNPIITPVIEHAWQKDATFNPAAVNDGEKVHLLYRAMGPGNTSVLGHAESANGTDIDHRSDAPVYSPREWFEVPGRSAKAWFMSGGGYGGCEDPRITWVQEDKRFYLTYVAYNGMDAPRVALSSISEADFRNKKWNWTSPRLISKPHVVDKSAVLFPEKVNGKYVMMHRVFPNILVDFLDDLEFKNPRYLPGEYKIPPTVDGWDSRKISAGAPPIKTKDGWLLVYHAVDDKNDSQYKIGAMLLDLNEPWKVLHRTTQPMLEPSEWYENEGFKSGVAYPCGAVVKDGKLFVYYGGADTFICVASKDLETLLSELKNHQSVTIGSDEKPKTVIRHHA